MRVSPGGEPLLVSNTRNERGQIHFIIFLTTNTRLFVNRDKFRNCLLTRFARRLLSTYSQWLGRGFALGAVKGARLQMRFAARAKTRMSSAGPRTMHHRAELSHARNHAIAANGGFWRLSFAALVVMVFCLTANQASAGLIFSSETMIGGDPAGEALSEAYGGPIRLTHRNDRVADSLHQAFPGDSGTSSCTELLVVSWPAMLPPGRQFPLLEPIASLARNNLLLLLSGPIFERLRPPRAS